MDAKIHATDVNPDVNHSKMTRIRERDIRSNIPARVIINFTGARLLV